MARIKEACKHTTQPQDQEQEQDQDQDQEQTHPTTFLDIAEQRLEEYYDRVLSVDTVCVDNNVNNDSMFSELTKEQMFSLFETTYGVCLNTSLCKPIERIIEDTIRHYQQYFEAEQDILSTAKRYDKLKTWLNHTREVFETQHIQPSREQTQDLQKQIETYMNSSEEWNHKFNDAKQKWNQLCVSRQALNTIHNLVGGTSACKICFNKQVKTLLVPCGHVLCKECAERVTCCPFCNTSFYTRQDIYFV